jgi:hypothetical protein
MSVVDRKQTVYHLSPVRLWLVPGILLVIGLFIGTLPIFDPGVPDNGKKLAFIMGIALLVFAAVMYLILRRTRLVLSPGGVSLYQFGYTLETGWENVAALNEYSGEEGLILHRSMDGPGARKLSDKRHAEIRGANLFNDEQIQLIAEHRLIPLNAFSYWLKKGKLRDDLIQRAPALNKGYMVS